jgi:hypothetical protein
MNKFKYYTIRVDKVPKFYEKEVPIIQYIKSKG